SYRTGIIFDGSVTLNNEEDVIVQTITGIDQAAGSGNSKMGFIVGDGQSFPERLQIGPNPTTFTNTFDSPFAGPWWDDKSYSLTSAELPPNASSVTAKLDHLKGSFDCLSVSVMYV